MSRDFVKKLVVLFCALLVSSLVFAQPQSSKAQTKKSLSQTESSSKKKIVYTKPKSELSTKMSQPELSDEDIFDNKDEDEDLDEDEEEMTVVNNQPAPAAAPAPKAEPKPVVEEAKPITETKPAEQPKVTTKPIETPVRKKVGGWDLPVQLDEDVRIAKVYEFLNDREKTKTGRDAAYNYEFKYFNHGAVTEEQKKAKRGHYFIVSWENSGPSADMVLRFDYRQTKTQDKVHTLEIPFKNADGFYKATFSVVGDAYAARGTIKSWRVAVIKNGVIIAKEQSYIW